MFSFISSFFNKYPSAFGFISIIIWSFSALFASIIKDIPTFELLGMIFSISFISIMGKVTIYKEWHKLKQPVFLTVVGIVAIFANDFFYFQAFKYAPSAQIDIINYLWPILVIIFSTVFTGVKLKLNHIFGSLVSFFGIYVFIAYDSNITFSISYLPGYIYALLDAITWAVYVLFSSQYKKYSSEVVGIYCGAAMILSWLTHSATEAFITPSLSQFLVIFVVGIFAQGLAYLFWDKGIKKGNSLLLTTYSYFTPLLSISILIIFSMAQYSHALILGALFVTIGVLIANRSN